MPRKLKPQKVDDVRNPGLGITIDLMLDRNELDFFFEFQDEVYRAPNIDALRSQARRVIRDSTDIDLKPVILVTFRTHDPFSAGRTLSLRFERFYMAQRDDKKWVRAHWHTPSGVDKRRNVQVNRELNLLIGDELSYPVIQEGTRDSKYLVPFTEATWEGLEQLDAALKVLTDKLTTMLGSADGWAGIAHIGDNALKLLSSGD